MKRFFEKVVKTDTCWNWTAAIRGKSGYGCMKYQGRVIDAHRISWMLHKGDIPKDKLVCHTCDNRKCVNPEHLFLGSYKDNMQDCISKNRFYFMSNEELNKGRSVSNLNFKNKTLKSKGEIDFVKDKIKNRTTTLKELAEELILPYQLIRDISCGRIYK